MLSQQNFNGPCTLPPQKLSVGETAITIQMQTFLSSCVTISYSNAEKKIFIDVKLLFSPIGICVGGIFQKIRQPIFPKFPAIRNFLCPHTLRAPSSPHHNVSQYSGIHHS